MSKRRRACSTSPGPSKRSRLSNVSTHKSEGDKSREEMKEWEDATCPVCLEHPHNAVLLICSSYAKGCRPFMCNTSQLHSNCLDKFCKSFPEPSNPESSSGASTSDKKGKEEGETPGVNSFPSMQKLDHNLVCPLCRGQISGWTVVQGARTLMDSKTRSCPCEGCEFSGNYRDMRKHARIEHPQARPSEADPERQLNWRHREQQSDIEDLFNIIRSSLGIPGGDVDVDEDLGPNPEHQQVDNSNNNQSSLPGGDDEEEQISVFAIYLVMAMPRRSLPPTNPRNNGQPGATRVRVRRVPLGQRSSDGADEDDEERVVRDYHTAQDRGARG